MSDKTTKKTRKSKADRVADEDLDREYRFDYSKSRGNRFSDEFPEDSVVVVLDPDVAEVFRDPKQVNSLLRATIAAVAKSPKRKSG